MVGRTVVVVVTWVWGTVMGVETGTVMGVEAGTVMGVEVVMEAYMRPYPWILKLTETHHCQSGT